ncbi:hypothetical protein [Actinomadura flavalba]|uniref:hypothetical protein n=1 Tax=Actinomadura flavalba TaxID=1120938 RepID=UPI000526D4E0|nr:hypothetical protein [Actinomadura flavalba]
MRTVGAAIEMKIVQYLRSRGWSVVAAKDKPGRRGVTGRIVPHPHAELLQVLDRLFPEFRFGVVGGAGRAARWTAVSRHNSLPVPTSSGDLAELLCTIGVCTTETSSLSVVRRRLATMNGEDET